MAVSDQLRELFSQGRVRQIKRGEVFQTSEEPTGINIIIRGAVKRYMITNDGSLGVQIFYGADDVFPLTVVHNTLLQQSLYDGPETYYYETLGPTTLRTIDSKHLKLAVRKDPMLYRDLLAEAGKHLFSCVQQLENLSLHTAYKRVAHQLLYFARHFGEAQKEGIKIIMPLTQQDIADMLSLTRETVSTCINDLRKKGLIISGKRNIIVPKIKKLENEAYN